MAPAERLRRSQLTDKLSQLQVSLARQNQSRNEPMTLKGRHTRLTNSDIHEVDTNKANGVQVYESFYDSKQFKS